MLPCLDGIWFSQKCWKKGGGEVKSFPSYLLTPPWEWEQGRGHAHVPRHEQDERMECLVTTAGTVDLLLSQWIANQQKADYTRVLLTTA